MCCGKKIRVQEQPPASPKGLPGPIFQRTLLSSPPVFPRATNAPKGPPSGASQRGLPPPIFQRTAAPSNPSPQGATIGFSAPPSGAPEGNPTPQSTITIRETNEVCPKCAAKLGIQLRYSDRLRRHYEVKWCATCKEGR